LPDRDTTRGVSQFGRKFRLPDQIAGPSRIGARGSHSGSISSRGIAGARAIRAAEPVADTEGESIMMRMLSAMGVAAVLAVPLRAQTTFVLDNFTAVQNGTSSVQSPSIVGGERDVIANGGSTFSAGSGLGSAALGAGLNSNFVLLDYDGLDNSTATNFGLNGFDVTQGGTMDRFRLYVESVTGTVSATVRMAEAGQTSLDYTDLSLSISSAGAFDFLLPSFPVAANVDITSVERMFLRFNLDAGESITVSRFELFGPGTGPVPVPEPATAGLVVVGIAAALAFRRRSASRSA